MVFLLSLRKKCSVTRISLASAMQLLVLVLFSSARSCGFYICSIFSFHWVLSWFRFTVLTSIFFFVKQRFNSLKSCTFWGFCIQLLNDFSTSDDSSALSPGFQHHFQNTESRSVPNFTAPVSPSNRYVKKEDCEVLEFPNRDSIMLSDVPNFLEIHQEAVAPRLWS